MRLSTICAPMPLYMACKSDSGLPSTRSSRERSRRLRVRTPGKSSRRAFSGFCSSMGFSIHGLMAVIAASRPDAGMTLLLAPMEGLLDFVLRDVLTRVGGVDRCVSEFIRITGTLLPDKVFLRYVPELHNGSRTLAGVPVRAQLLG